MLFSPTREPPVPATRLRILVIGNGVLDCASTNCVTALRSMGHDAAYFDPDEHPSALAPLRRSPETKRYVDRAIDAVGLATRLYERAMVEAVRAYEPDLLLVIPVAQVSARAIDAVKKHTSVPVAGWFQDSLANFGRHEFLLAGYDALFFKDPHVVERLRDYAGLPHIHFLPEACEPSVHRSLPLSETDRCRYTCELMVYGNLYPYRARILEHVSDYDLRLYGAAPPAWLTHPIRSRWQGQAIFREDKIKAVAAAKIVVNDCHYAEIRSVNARLFEVAGIGGFQVSDAPGVANFFVPGVEIATFKGPADLRKVVAHYLAHPEERAAMSARAQDRAHREHTYAHRLDQLMQTVGLMPPQEPARVEDVGRVRTSSAFGTGQLRERVASPIVSGSNDPRAQSRRLRVLVIGNGTLDCASTNCVTALRAMGHEATYFDPDEHPRFLAPFRRSWEMKRYVNRAIDAAGLTTRLYESAMVDAVGDYSPDLVLVIPLAQVSARAIAGMKKRSPRVQVAAWFQDHVANLDRHECLVSDYDGLFFKDPYIVERLRDYADRKNVHLLPEACEPTIHKSLSISEEELRRYGCDLMVYGNLYPYRARILEHLSDYEVRLYGAAPSPWLTHPSRQLWQGQTIFGDEKIKAVLAAKIIVNSCHYGEIRSVNARLFEVAGIGGFQVSDAPGVGDYFEPGVEIATFKGPRELREVIAHYLAHPEERELMAARAQRRAHRDHTYSLRLVQLLETLGLTTRRHAPQRDITA